MKTWLDATCTAAGGSVGGGPVPDSGASPDIPRPPYDLASCRQDAPEASGPQLAAGAGLLFATRRCLAAAACREWPLQIDISACCTMTFCPVSEPQPQRTHDPSPPDPERMYDSTNSCQPLGLCRSP